MKLTKHIFFIVIIFSCVNVRAQTEIPFGNYKVYKWIDGSITEYHYEQADSMINKKLSIDKTKVIFLNKVYDKVNFRIESIDTDNYLAHLGIGASDLGIQDTIKFLSIRSCDLKQTPLHVLIDDKKIIVEDGGFFYFCKKIE